MIGWLVRYFARRRHRRAVQAALRAPRIDSLERAQQIDRLAALTRDSGGAA